jgi:hypothetical protein
MTHILFFVKNRGTRRIVRANNAKNPKKTSPRKSWYTALIRITILKNPRKYLFQGGIWFRSMGHDFPCIGYHQEWIINTILSSLIL